MQRMDPEEDRRYKGNDDFSPEEKVNEQKNQDRIK